LEAILCRPQQARYFGKMIELLTSAEMARADRLTIAGGTAGIDLMEKAGEAVAETVAAHYPHGPVLVIAGPGNNGGDGFVAARLIAARGRHVRVALVGDANALRGDAAMMAQRWSRPIEPAAPERVDAPAVIVDALFGAGLDRPVEGLARAMIEAMNASGVPIVSVDLPSGVNGTTGAVMGVAVRAARTITFFRRKPGHLLLPGRIHCGVTELAQIGIHESVLDEIKPRTFVNAPPLWRGTFPIPRIDGHKYSRGHAVIVSGGASYTGAARLAARGALRAGAGLVTIACPPDALAIHAAANLAVMVRATAQSVATLAEHLSDERLNAVVLGPGGGVGQSMREMVEVAAAGQRAVVLDADALTSFADHLRELLTILSRRAGGDTILTPHTGEFSRLFRQITEKSETKQKLEVARAASHETSAVVLLKGADTVVAAPDGRASIAENAPPWLATAGTGDVLSGMIAGLSAQGMPAFEAASAGVWLHGEAASAFGPGLISEDLPEALPGVYRRLFEGLAR
jgi:hydroxyethylthiazole kinase-like uncharacterized protein yjeF